jgi:hypothetical protein
MEFSHTDGLFKDAPLGESLQERHRGSEYVNAPRKRGGRWRCESWRVTCSWTWDFVQQCQCLSVEDSVQGIHGIGVVLKMGCEQG